MRATSRMWLVGMLVCAVAGVWASGAQAAEFGIESFVAVNCAELHEECAQQSIGPYSFPKEPSKAEAEEGGYAQAAGHVPFGVTHFKVTTEGEPFPNSKPTGVVTHIRTDVAPGLSTNPTAVPQCKLQEFGTVEAVPGTGFYPAPGCNSNTVIGKNKVVVYVEASPTKDVPLEGSVYNLVQSEGLSSEFGVAINLAPLGLPFFAHTLIEGHIEWGRQAAGTGAGDYHDYFEINVSPALPLISSRLVFFGRSGEGDFIVNPTNCSGNTTNTLTLMSSAGTARRTYTPPIGVSGCELVPFEPGFSLMPLTTQSDQPDGLATALTIPHNPAPESLDDSQLRSATVTLPEGMTLNPSAAHGLEACTPSQARVHSEAPGVSCPEKSQIGTFALEVPDLPPGSLGGKIYLGGPEPGPITGPPYTMYLDAESPRYGISVRLRGEAIPNEATGRVTAVFPENPEQPFSEALLKFTAGALAPIANPLVCGPARAQSTLLPYTGTLAKSPFSQFVVDSNNAGGACPSPLPFSLAQSTEDHPTTGAAHTNFTLNLARPDGQQYLSKVSTTLPEGLLGRVPAVPRCAEAQANAGTCSSASQIGIVTVNVGSGPTPTQFSGPVYLTGPYAGAPYGLSIVIHAAVGPFDLGLVVTRATININPFTARVIVESTLPTIVKGIPLRLKTLSVAINRQGFLVNPTNCGVLSTDTLLTSTFGSTQLVSTPFQASGCSALPFKPRLVARTNAKASRHNGAMLEVSVGYPLGPQANIKSVKVQLPKQLPSRASTLNKACPEATFKANPYSCPAGSAVGGATATTPLLPAKITGRAFFVSHGGAAFPDLDLVMSGNGLTIILVGNTNISKGITTTTFASIPDAPVSGFHLKLPYGRFSALAARSNLCRTKLIMPTTITAQNGKVIKQRTRISVSGCGVQILSHRVRGHVAVLKLQVFSAGRLTVGGGDLIAVTRKLRKAGTLTVSVPLSAAGLSALAHHSPLRVRVRASFAPRKGHRSSASTVVGFR